MSTNLLFEPEANPEIHTREVSGNGPPNTTDDRNSATSETSLSTTLQATTTQATEESSTGYVTSTIANWTSTVPQPGEPGSSSTVVIVIISLLVVVASIILIYAFFKKGKFINLPCCKTATRARRSSSSSSKRALEEHEQEVMDEDFRQKPEGQADDTFTIDDFEGNVEVPEAREEYYYDEVFGQSQFEDETTNNAMRQLYSDGDAVPEEEILDLDFETLGIRIQDYSPDPGRKINL